MTELKIGLHKRELQVAQPNAEWTEHFAQTKALLLAAAPALKFVVEHIGSTSVPALAAKPIIDVGVLLSSAEDFPPLKEAFEKIGLLYGGDQGANGGHLFARESAADWRTDHIHVLIAGDPQWAEYLDFRQRLRGSRALCREYEALKRSLKAQHGNNREAYTEGKTGFIQGVLTRKL